MVRVKVPATSANIGPGFDCIGLAVKLYNEVEIGEISEGLVIEEKKTLDMPIPTDETNLIYQSFKQFYTLMGMSTPAIRIVQNDDIPMTRGLGSSAACIVAGLSAANELSGKRLSRFELAQMAAGIEGHPDNVVPAILGGMVAAALDDLHKMKYVKIDIPDEIVFAAIVPDFPLSTEAARAVLPKEISLKDGIFNASRAALLVASIMTKNWDNLDFATNDRFHQPYRKSIINNMDDIMEKAAGLGAKGTFLSGAGPTILAIVKKEDRECFADRIAAYLETLADKWTVSMLSADNEGAVVEWV